MDRETAEEEIKPAGTPRQRRFPTDGSKLIGQIARNKNEANTIALNVKKNKRQAGRLRDAERRKPVNFKNLVS